VETSLKNRRKQQLIPLLAEVKYSKEHEEKQQQEQDVDIQVSHVTGKIGIYN
jgi:hypothetical protein